MKRKKWETSSLGRAERGLGDVEVLQQRKGIFEKPHLMQHSAMTARLAHDDGLAGFRPPKQIFQASQRGSTALEVARSLQIRQQLESGGGQLQQLQQEHQDHLQLNADAVGSKHRRDAVVRKVTVGLPQTYKQCSPEFKYLKSLNPRRALTKDCKGRKNGGFDNEANDLILIVNDVIAGRSEMRYSIVDMLGQGSFGQVAKCRVRWSRAKVAAARAQNLVQDDLEGDDYEDEEENNSNNNSNQVKGPEDDSSSASPASASTTANNDPAQESCREEACGDAKTGGENDRKHHGHHHHHHHHHHHDQKEGEFAEGDKHKHKHHHKHSHHHRELELNEGDYVAVKVIKNKPAYHNQALVETRILRMLNAEETAIRGNGRRRIVELLESFEHKNHLCLVFEMLSMNLYELIKLNKFRGLPMGFIRSCTQQILDALLVLARADVVHCDLKPENILLESVGRPHVKLIDFGSSCFSDQTVYTYIQSRFYRAPEVLVGMSYGPAIDLWSLGCVAAELYIGLPIFPGVSEHNQLSRIQETVGDIPDSLLDKSKETRKFYLRSSDPASGKAWRLKSPKVWALEQRLDRPEKTKRYVRQILLKDIVYKCSSRADADDPQRPNRGERLSRVLVPWDKEAPLPTTDETKRMKTRESFLDLLAGLLQLDPRKRWTAAQASKHPFILNENLREPFRPDRIPSAPPPSSKPLTPIPAPSMVSNPASSATGLSTPMQDGVRMLTPAAVTAPQMAPPPVPVVVSAASTVVPVSATDNTTVNQQQQQHQQQEQQQQQMYHASKSGMIMNSRASGSSSLTEQTKGKILDSLEQSEQAILDHEAMRSPHSGNEDDADRSLASPNSQQSHPQGGSSSSSPTLASVDSVSMKVLPLNGPEDHTINPTTTATVAAAASTSGTQAMVAPNNVIPPSVGGRGPAPLDLSDVSFHTNNTNNGSTNANTPHSVHLSGIISGNSSASNSTRSSRSMAMATPRHAASSYSSAHASPYMTSSRQTSPAGAAHSYSSTSGMHSYSPSSTASSSFTTPSSMSNHCVGNRGRLDSDASSTPRSPYSMLSPLSRPSHPYPLGHQASWDAMASGYLGVDMRLANHHNGNSHGAAMPILPPNASIGSHVSSRAPNSPSYAHSLSQSQFIPARAAPPFSLGGSNPNGSGNRHRSHSMMDPRHSSYRWYPTSPFFTSGMPAPHQQVVAQHGFWAGSPPALSHGIQGSEAVFAMAQVQAQAQAQAQAQIQAQLHAQAQMRYMNQPQQMAPPLQTMESYPQHHARHGSQGSQGSMMGQSYEEEHRSSYGSFNEQGSYIKAPNHVNLNQQPHHHQQQEQQYAHSHSLQHRDNENFNAKEANSPSLRYAHDENHQDNRNRDMRDAQPRVSKLQPQSSEASQEVEMKLGAQQPDDEATLFKLSPELPLEP